MKNKGLVCLAIAAVALLGAACGAKVSTNTEVNTNVGDEIPSVNIDYNTNTDSSANVNTSVSVNSNTNSTTTKNTNVTTSNGGLTIDKPTANEQIASPFTVSGKSAAKTVYVRIIGNQNATLISEPVTVRNGAYTINITFTFTHTQNGRVEVYEKDSTGVEVNLVSIPENFQPAVSTTQTNTNSSTNTNTGTNTNLYYPY